jgi:hypothetical protein
MSYRTWKGLASCCGDAGSPARAANPPALYSGEPPRSWLIGIGIACGSLIAMPVLASQKRKVGRCVSQTTHALSHMNAPVDVRSSSSETVTGSSSRW